MIKNVVGKETGGPSTEGRDEHVKRQRKKQGIRYFAPLFHTDVKTHAVVLTQKQAGTLFKHV